MNSNERRLPSWCLLRAATARAREDASRSVNAPSRRPYRWCRFLRSLRVVGLSGGWLDRITRGSHHSAVATSKQIRLTRRKTHAIVLVSAIIISSISSKRSIRNQSDGCFPEVAYHGTMRVASPATSTAVAVVRLDEGSRDVIPARACIGETNHALHSPLRLQGRSAC